MRIGPYPEDWDFSIQDDERTRLYIAFDTDERPVLGIAFDTDEQPVLGPPEPVNPTIHWYLYGFVKSYRDAYDTGRITVYNPDRTGTENPVEGHPSTPT